MSLILESAVDEPSSHTHSSWYVRPSALIMLLLAEALAFTIRFDAPHDADLGAWWGWLLWNCHQIVNLMLLAVMVAGSFAGLRFWVRLRRALEVEHDAEGSARWTICLLAHGASLVNFTLVASAVCDGGLTSSASPGGWVAALIVSGLVVGATWFATVLPLSTWMAIVGRSVRPFAMGVAVAGGVFLVSRYTGDFWDTMAGTTMGLVYWMLRLVSRDVISDQASLTLGVGNFQGHIANTCSGFEGIGLVVTFLSAYLGWFRHSFRWPRAYLLLPLGAVLIWLFNAVRIASLILIGAWVSPAVAMGGFHSQAGWIAFLGVSLGMVAASRRSSFFAAEGRPVVDMVGSNPSASFLGPFLIVLATAMITAAFSSGFDLWYGLRALTGGAALWYFRRDFAGLLRGCSWVGVAVGLIAFGLWVALEPASAGGSGGLASHVAALPRGQALTWIAFRVIGSVAIIPLVEELAFRGYLTRRLLSVDFQSVPIGQFSWLSMLLSSAAFGLLHGRWLAGMLVGVLYALAMYRRGKLGDAVLAHAVTNLLIAVTVLATGDWAMWS